jgi:hypothetical protein
MEPKERGGNILAIVSEDEEGAEGELINTEDKVILLV